MTSLSICCSDRKLSCGKTTINTNSASPISTHFPSYITYEEKNVISNKNSSKQYKGTCKLYILNFLPWEKQDNIAQV
ncbi:hypothetical protein Hanom_Chr04g00356781 [Helianthus anomalus]